MPLLVTEPPIVATGMEKDVARNSSMVVRARKAGKVTYADADRIQSLLRDARIDTILHIGALSIVAESVAQPERYFKTNLVGSITLLDAAVARVQGHPRALRVEFEVAVACRGGFDCRTPSKPASQRQ